VLQVSSAAPGSDWLPRRQTSTTVIHWLTLVRLRSLQFCQEPLDELIIGSEVRLAQAIERDTQLQEAVLGGVGEHAKS